MAIKTTITCDACGNDLSDFGPYPGHYLNLESRVGPSTSPVRHTIHVSPAIQTPHHFCGKRCLRDWITAE